MLTLGHAIYLWRRERHLTQSELARLSGISRPNLSTIEQGGRDVTVGTLRRLARALGVQPGVLVDGVPPEGYSRVKLDRRKLDRLARWLSGKPVRLSRQEKQLVRVVQPLMKRKTGLAKRRGGSLPRTAQEEKDSLLRAKIELGPAEIRNLLGRVEKLLRGAP